MGGTKAGSYYTETFHAPRDKVYYDGGDRGREVDIRKERYVCSEEVSRDEYRNQGAPDVNRD